MSKLIKVAKTSELGPGPLRGHTIECPRHGAQFDVRTGAVVRMPAYVGVETYPVQVEGNDILIKVE
ncbi:Rieske 2Fe-2S domain-containing protein [Candidatus Acetothermia bacterium]|nr:Rieske 2Fe-2S domain-containing protein [Candidatus Acetothermia bacterium]